MPKTPKTAQAPSGKTEKSANTAKSADKPAAAKAASGSESTIDDFAARVAKAREGLAAIRALLPDLRRLNPEARKTSIGRLRDGEDAIIESVLDMVDESPAVFQSLASRDNGVDPAAVETAPSRDDLAQRAALQPFADDLVLLAEDVSDTLLDLGARPRTFSIAAYAIGQANAPHDARVKRGLARAERFYASHGRPKGKSGKAI
jgi:hypothetical protein